MRFLFLLFVSIFIFAADLDFDGVDDSKDYCPRTPLLAIVNNKGCEIDKKIPFNFDIETGEDYILPQKIPQQYFKTTMYLKSYESAFYYSRVKIEDKFHTYTTLFDFSKRFYNDNGYTKLSFIYYPVTYYNKKADKAFKLTYYFAENDILVYYKFKYTGEYAQKNNHTFFFEKFIKYPKIILVPFFYFENTYYSNKFDKYIGISAIVRLKGIYTKFAVSKSEKGEVFSFSIGKSF
jgi:hypothetical protein